MAYKRSKGIHFESAFQTGVSTAWSYNAVRRILANDVYLGILTQGKRGRPNHKVKPVKWKDESEWVKVENAHEPLVSYEDFMATQEMLKRDMRCAPEQAEVHPLSGFLFCGDCGRSMVCKSTYSKTKKYVYYICSAHRHSNECSPHSISGKLVEETVLQAIHDQVELVIRLDKALDLIAALPSENRKAFSYEAQIARLEEEIEQFQKRKLRLYEDLADGIIDKSDYADFREQYNNTIAEKETAILRLRKEHQILTTTGTTERNWVTLFKQYENIETLNRRVMMSLVDRVLIYENHAIEIVFKYRNEYEQAMNYVLGYPDELAKAI